MNEQTPNLNPGDEVIVYAGPAYGRKHVVERIVNSSRIVARLPPGFYMLNRGCGAISVPVCDCEKPAVNFVAVNH